MKKFYREGMMALLTMSQEALGDAVQGGNDIILEDRDNYMIWSKDSIPKPMLCVHLDTINSIHNIIPTYDDIYMGIQTIGLVSTSSAKCLGGDDRAGVYIAMHMIQWMEDNNYFPYDVGFFYDEEVGGLGSSKYAQSLHKLNTTCYIGLDRRSHNGEHEVATYGMTNQALLDLFIAEGYKETMGTFTDASNLASDDISCINLSVGYDNEHTSQEVVYIDSMMYTLDVLKSINIPSVEYPIDVFDEYDTHWGEYRYQAEEEEEEYTSINDSLSALEEEVQDLKAEMQEVVHELMRLRQVMLGM